MSLATNLYFFGSAYERQPLRRDVMDALVARLPEAEQRHRIATYGAIRVALNEFDWLLERGGAETLLDPPVAVFTTAMRRFGDAPVDLNPLDLLRRFHALGWIPQVQLADLPGEALQTPREGEAISLDRVLARFFPRGTIPADISPNAVLESTPGLREAIDAHVAEQRALHGALREAGDS